jgi:hypothetical protein
MSDETPTASEAPDAPEAPQENSTQDVHDLRQEVAKLRREAAKYRSDEDPEHKALRSEVAKYQRQADAADRAKAKLIQEHDEKLLAHDSTFSELQGELSARSLELLKLKAVLAEGIASEDALDVASLVQGTDEASISDSVKRVKSLIGKAPEKARPIDPSQGSGNHVPLNGDPILETVRRMVGA